MKHRTAMGKTIDMAALISKNEKVRAVGNMGVNARGDIIDNHGKIIKSVNQRVNDRYSKTVGQKTAQAKSGPVEKQPKRQTIQEELTDYEKELQQDLDQDDFEIDKLKNGEKK